MLGLEELELIVDGCFLIVRVPPVALALLGARAAAGGWRLVCFEAVGFALPPLEEEDAVGAVKEDGNATGFVGDLGLGFTKPVP